MRFAPILLAAVCALVLFVGLGRIGLVDQREARDMEVARELIADREFLTPLLGHESWYEKPLLAYVPEVAARITSPSPDLRSRQLRALGALLLVVLTASIAAQHFGGRAAWCAGLVLATSLATPLAARTDGTQVFATILGWMGAAGLADAVFGRSAGRDRRLTVSYVALAAALVFAGPMPALWPLGALALYAGLARAASGLRQAQPIAGLILIAGLALPWYGAMVERHGLGFLSHAAFFPYATESRGHWYSGLLMTPSFLVVGFFPWSTLLPEAILHAGTWWRATRRPVPVALGPTPANHDPVARERHEEGAAHFFIACLIAAIAPIALYPGAPLASALPALPAAAILCGRFLDHLFEDAQRLAVPIGRGALILAVFGSLVALMLNLAAPHVPEATTEIRLLATALFATSWLPFLANFLGRRRLAATLMLFPIGLGTPLVAIRVLPALETYLNARATVEALNLVSPPRAPLVLLDPPSPSLRLYAGHNLVWGEPLDTELTHHRAADGFTYLAFLPSREREVARGAGTPLEILKRTPSLVLARVRRE